MSWETSQMKTARVHATRTHVRTHAVACVSLTLRFEKRCEFCVLRIK